MRPSLEHARLALQRHFGYPDFRPGQVDVIAAVLGGRDTLGVLPTGGGKSLCYQVPALLLPGVTVVISPLISLMKDQVDRLVSRGIAATFLNSTLDTNESSRRLAGVRNGIVKLLYVAPERFRNPHVLDALAQGGVALLAVDEAHCISEWGHEFRPSFRRIREGAARFSGLQVVALTATATPAVRRDIVAQLGMREPHVLVGGFDRPNLSYAVLRCDTDDEKERALLRLLAAEPGLAVIYAPTRADVSRVARQLTHRRIRAAAYHGGLPHRQRLQSQDAFMQERVRAIVATSAFGMGVDKPNVRLVVHNAMPGTLEAYYQEAGRAGRDGRPGRCVLLYGPDDRATHDFFIRGTFPSAEVVRRVLGALMAVSDGLRVPGDATSVARRARLAPNEVAASMRWMEREGVLRRGGGDAGVHLRLLALAARIARELPEYSDERRMLRTLWRQSGDRLFDGVTLRTSRLQKHVLTALRERQFVDFDADEDMLRFSNPSPTLSAASLARLERRRATETAKLERMIAYAETARCRRATVLAYFGERLPAGRCGGCDNCQQAG